MRLTTHSSIMGRKHDLAYGLASIWKRKLKNDRYELIENAIDKLGQLEDIEDELGIDLITLFNALKNGIYYTNYGHGTINYCDKPRLIPCYMFVSKPNKQIEKETWGYDFIVSKKGLTLGIKTYKKYWALTKEELENE